MNNRQILSAAIGSLLALGLVSNASAAGKKMDMEQCYGDRQGQAIMIAPVTRARILAQDKPPKTVMLRTSLPYPKALAPKLLAEL